MCIYTWSKLAQESASTQTLTIVKCPYEVLAESLTCTYKEASFPTLSCCVAAVVAVFDPPLRRGGLGGPLEDDSKVSIGEGLLSCFLIDDSGWIMKCAH